MDRGRRTAGLAFVALLGTAFAPGQTVEVKASGVPSLDVVAVTPGMPGVPLRFGNVIPRSERITLGGRVLQAGTDYALDYAAGVVYLYRAARAGDSITAEYRYDKAASPAAPAALGITSFALLPGLNGSPGLMMNMGLGVTERAADGTVLRSNLFGTNGSLAFGKTSLTGAYLVGQRSKVDVQNGMAYDRAARPGDAATDTGDSRFIAQTFATAVSGGSLRIERQDISSNFVGFSSLRGGAFSDGRLAELSKERGLVRNGFALEGAKGLGGAWSYAQRNVSDGKGAVDWRSYGFASGGFAFRANSRRASTGFARFKDIAEADRDQIAREAGLDRGDWAATFAGKSAKISLTGVSVAQGGAAGDIQRREAKLDLGKTAFEFGEQKVGAGFSRFDSLLGAEKAMWGQEAGLSRRWLAARSSNLLGAEVAFRRSEAKDTKGGFTAESALVKGRTWSLEHVATNADAGFSRIGSFSGQELGERANEIAAMYNGRPFAKDQGVQGGDVEALKRGSGIGRTFDRLALAPAKGTNLEATRLVLSGAKDAARVETLSATSRKASFNFRRMRLGENFTELTSLLGLERARLGDVPGLSRTDLALSLQLASRSNLKVETMNASAPAGSASRTRVAYNDPTLQFAYAAREIGKDPTLARSLVDDERDALAALAGYKGREVALNWQALKSLNLQYGEASYRDTLLQRERGSTRLALLFQPDPSLKIGYAKSASRSLQGGETDPLTTLFAETTESLSVTKRLGNWGVEYARQTRDFVGTEAKAPSSDRTFVALESKVAAGTTLRAERTATEYSDGTSEKIATNSVSTTLTKRMGVTVADTKIDRDGTAQDQTKRDYGLWMDFGKGVRLSYGYVRSLDGAAAGSRATTFQIGQNAGRTDAANVNNVGAANVNGTEFAFGSAGNMWDDQTGRVQSFNNLRLKTTRPFGFLGFSACALLVDMDTASDKAVWIRENRRMAFSGRLLGTDLGVEYRGQTDPSGQRAIDRTVRVKTSGGPKAPLAASLMFKERTLPTNERIAIRDLSLELRPAKGVTLTNQLRTNPETPRPDVLLGSVPAADRANKWKLDFSSGGTIFGGQWEETRNDASNSLARTAGLNLSLFGRSGSPLTLFYGLEQRSDGGVRRNLDRYSLSFDQRPGPNQVLSLFVGNLAYSGTIDPAAPNQNWSVRLNYQLRF